MQCLNFYCLITRTNRLFTPSTSYSQTVRIINALLYLPNFEPFFFQTCNGFFCFSPSYKNRRIFQHNYAVFAFIIVTNKILPYLYSTFFYLGFSIFCNLKNRYFCFTSEMIQIINAYNLCMRKLCICVYNIHSTFSTNRYHF